MSARVEIRIEERPRKRRRHRWPLKSLLATLILVGAIASVTVSGTFAMLSSQETNAGGTAASGTLTLGNVVDSGTACFSYGAGSSQNQNTDCTALTSDSTLEYPGSTATATVEITNNGTVAGNDLGVFMPSCTASTTSGAPAPGGGDPCTELTDSGGNPDGLQLVIEETDSTGTPIACWYPVTLPAAPCSSDPTDYDASLPNSFPLFGEYLNAWDGGAYLDTGGDRLAPGETRYFKVSVILPNDASNSLQGEQVTFSLTWHLTTSS